MIWIINKLFIIFSMLIIFLGNAFALDKVPVFVSIVPQKYFVQQIGKELVEVRVMVQPGASPHTYEPKPEQLAGLTKAKLYLAIGVPFEKAWLKRFTASNPEMKVVQTDQDIKKLGYDPHIWLSPPLVKIQARTIMTALKEMDPENKGRYEAHYQKFVAEIEGLDGQLKQIFSGKKGLQFMVFHPAWGYFAQAYGIEQVPIEIEGKDPKPAQLKELIKQARAKKIRVIFVQPQFSTKSADLVAKEIGGQVVFADPLAEDWMTNLSQVAHQFKTALK
jgi:zinc transport system substrate-binding protein